MSKVEALTALLAKVEAGAAPEYGIFRESRSPTIWSGLHGDFRSDAWNAYNGSLDAAKALHEAVLPGWDWAVFVDGRPGAQVSAPDDHIGKYKTFSSTEMSCSPARAFLQTILAALIAEASQ